MKVTELALLLAIPELPVYVDQVQSLLLATVGASNQELNAPATRLLKSGGKRLRPILVMAASMACGNDLSEATVIASSSIELLHIASLVHDDIIDQASLRHGEPTVSAQEGLNSAILVGDYFIALAHTQAALVSNDVAYVLARAFAAMCDGQSRELNDKFNADRTLPDYLVSIRQKTALLLGAACQIGGLCSGMNEDQVKALGRFGAAFGMSFQLIDDLIDLQSSTAIAGKPVGNDLLEGIYTMPILHALQGPDSSLVRSWLKNKSAKLPTRQKIMKTLTQDGSIEKTLAEVVSYNIAAHDALTQFEDTPIIVGLKQLPAAYLRWALPNGPSAKSATI